MKNMTSYKNNMNRRDFMKKITAFLLSLIFIFSTVLMINVNAAEAMSIILEIGNPNMNINGREKPIDNEGTSPVIIDGRTLVPIRAVVEEMGGSVNWNADTQTVLLENGNDSIELVIGSTNAKLNGQISILDTAPVIINGRTMLPIRFISEGFGFNVEWDSDTHTINISSKEKQSDEAMQAVTEDIAKEINEETAKAKENKSLIVYFSRTGENYGVGYIDVGNTAHIANFIKEKTGADSFEIIAKEPYPDVYKECTARAETEKNENARPEYIGEVKNIDDYDTVYIGYPIWWSTMPMIVMTFLENNDLSGKTIIPFSTHEGSGWGSSLNDLEKLCHDSTIADGFSIKGTNAENSQSEVNSWLESLN